MKPVQVLIVQQAPPSKGWSQSAWTNADFKYVAEADLPVNSANPDESDNPAAPNSRFSTLDDSSRTLHESSYHEASCADSSKGNEPPFDRVPRRKKVWQPHVIVVGFYILSIFVAASHCLFFLYLDGRIVSPEAGLSGEKTTTTSQGFVTTISLLFTTAFRASLLASIAVCYAQHLWATLRTHVLKVGLVEDLFQVQTNPFHLASPGMYSKTPSLAAIAIFCWLVPIATVYLPSAVVVELLHSPIGTTFNVSVLHAHDYLFATNPKALSEIWCNHIDGENVDGIGPLELYREEMQQNTSFLDSCVARWGQTDDLRYITRSSLMSGELASLTPPTGENSSYAIQFWGTTLACQTLNQTIQRPITNEDVQPRNISWPQAAWLVRNFTTPCELWSDTYFDSSFEDPAIAYRVTRSSRTYRYFPCLDSIDKTPETAQKFGNVSLPSNGTNVLMDITETVCRPKLTKYLMNLSFAGGRQNISYILDDAQPVPVYSSAYRDFNGSYEQWVHFSDALSIYHEFAANLNRSTIVDYPISFNYTNSSMKSTPYTTSNGTIHGTCMLNRAPYVIAAQYSRLGHRAFDLEIWPLSVFERRFFRPIPDYDSFNSDCAQFDPEIAKELLINTTISSLALNKNLQPVNGVIHRVFNIYRFKDKLAFFLPYGLSIGLGIPIIGLGLLAFYSRNSRTSAITGGFLQLLVTTTRRTSLAKLITDSGTHGGRENVSNELKAAEITFGELVTSDIELSSTSVATESQRLGFGLAQEVRRL